MLPIFSCGFMVVAELFLPWFSMPVLKYSKLQTSYTLWNVSECVDNIQKSIRGGGKLSMELLTAEEIKTIGQWSIALQVFAIILTVLLIGAAIAAYRWKKKKCSIYSSHLFGSGNFAGTGICGKHAGKPVSK